VSVVSNSSPLIYLAALNDFALLKSLFHEIVIPPAVYREVVVDGAAYPVAAAVSAALDRWIFIQRPSSMLTPPHSAIHPGEADAIALAREIESPAVLMDDRAAVRWARSLFLLVIPTPVVYVEAKRQGRIGSVREKLQQLRDAGFWLKDSDLALVLREAGEP
jgi:predicted nucleic acid-binding protein